MDNATTVWTAFVHVLNYLAVSGYVPFLTIITLVAVIMYKAHGDSNSQFSMYDLVSSSISLKASIENIGMLMAMLAVTWWFMDLAAIHKATWTDAVAYGGLLGLAKVANKALDLKFTNKSYAPTDPSPVDETTGDTK
jgi:ABC-type methionine transport system permease subunit